MHLQVWAGKLFHLLLPICVALSLLVALIRGGELRCWQEGNFRRDSLNLSQATDKCLPGTCSAPKHCKALQALLGVDGGVLSCVCCCSFPAPVEVIDPAPLGENQVSSALGAPAEPREEQLCSGCSHSIGKQSKDSAIPCSWFGEDQLPSGCSCSVGKLSTCPAIPCSWIIWSRCFPCAS